MKTLAVFLVFSAILFSCKTNKETTGDNQINIMEAYFYFRSGGIESSSGNTYIVIIEKPDFEIQFENIWAHGVKVAMNTRTDETRLALRGDDYRGNPDEKKKNAASFPIPSNAEALISYKIDSDIQYLEIPKLEKKEGRIYQ